MRVRATVWMCMCAPLCACIRIYTCICGGGCFVRRSDAGNQDALEAKGKTEYVQTSKLGRQVEV